MTQDGKLFDVYKYDCPNCGRFTISGIHEQTLPDLDTDVRETLQEMIKKENAKDATPHVDEPFVQDARGAAL